MLVEDLDGEDREVGLTGGLVFVPLFGGAIFLLGADMLWKPQFTPTARKTLCLRAFLMFQSTTCVLHRSLRGSDADADNCY